MGLWIRSQDRETLLLINTCYLYQEDTKKIVGAGVDIRTNLILGKYKTKKRALEVLDEIEERICLLQTLEVVKGNETAMINFKNAIGEEKIKGLNYPYQMPKE